MDKSCKYLGRCGGCERLDFDISKELLEKKDYIASIFKDFDTTIHNAVGNFYPYKCRNKIQLAFRELKGKTLIGFYEENSSKVTDIDVCILNGDWSRKLIFVIREFLSRFKVRPYNNVYGIGILRYVHARCIDNNLQLTLVVTSDNFPGRDWLYNKLKESFKSVSFYLNINRRTDNLVLDKHFKFVAGEKELKFNFMGIKVSILPSSFLQVNLEIAEKMYKKACDLLEIKDEDTILDLYSGIGITSMLFAKKARKVISVEEAPSSVSNAKNMTKLNGVNNISINLGKCEDVIDSIESYNDISVFLDPARAGVESKVIDAILKFEPKTICYMSCNPETCARDVKLFSGKKYRVDGIYPYNMFPFSRHIEVLVKISRK